MPLAMQGIRDPRELQVLIWMGETISALVLITLLSFRSQWRAFWAWVTLYVAGHLCMLQMVDVGPVIKLQMFRYWSDVLHSYRAYFLFFLLLQFAVVSWAARRLLFSVFSSWRRVFTVPGILVGVCLLLYSLAVFTPDHVQSIQKGGFLKLTISHATKVGFAFVATWIFVLNLWLAVKSLPEKSLGDCLARGRALLASRWFPWIAALWVVVISSMLAVFVLDAIPHVPDEAAYVFNAKYLASGKLTIPVPPVPEAFAVPFYGNDETRWFVTPPVGWPLVLAMGFLIGAPWVINPLLGAAGLILLHRLVCRIYGPGAAGGIAALLALSPWFLFMNASFMTHPLTLVLFLLALLAISHVREAGSFVWAGLAGLAVGGLLHIRPLDAVIAAAIAGCWWLAAGLRQLRLKDMLATAACGLLMTALFLAYNKELTGDPLQVPIGRYVDVKIYPGANRLGFGKDIGNFGWRGLDPLPGHSPIDAMVNANQNLYMTNFEMFGWAFGSLLPMLALLGWKSRTGDGVWWFSIAAVIGGLSLYWFSGGPDYAARYWYMILPACLVLTWRGFETLIERVLRAGGEPSTEARVWFFVATASVLGFAILLPWRSIDKYKYYRGTRPDFRTMINANHWDKDLIFVRARAMPDYVSASPFNPPRFDRDAPGPIFVMDVGPEKNAILVHYYSNRQVWVVNGPWVTKGPAQIVAGPLPPGTSPPTTDGASATGPAARPQ